MKFKFGELEVTLNAAQITALTGLLTALYALARAFGIVDVGGVPVA